MNAEQFNARYPVGTLVFAYPGCRPEDGAGTRLVTRTRTAAQVSASGDPVVWVNGEGAYIALTHVDPVAEDVWAEALAAEMSAGQASAFAATCPTNPPGHDWQNGLTCRWCQATRTPAEAILSGLASRRGGDETSAEKLVAALTAEATAATYRAAADLVARYGAGSVEQGLCRDIATQLRRQATEGGVDRPDTLHTVRAERDQARAELAEFASRVNELESRLCECEPVREHTDYKRPAFYQHAADCPVNRGA
ncbi:hypothetical protein KVH30_01915 [Streptomyces olivaceus]|uniref:hypothetical protein n=1 Tax=Streptomyces olivaceus TaxID=47716 RepID=UPI001CCCE6C0|nr:hypothetical protein [Streptomyces olivaceus]MBZ6290327.1 hypothetical protein [Streptomyces olivaceus]MBZ6324279.1 hypothetical protein [Streptomyces olivaceus]